MGRKPIENKQFQEIARTSVKSFSRRDIVDDVWPRIEANIQYHAGGYDDPKSYLDLKEKILKIEDSLRGSAADGSSAFTAAKLAILSLVMGDRRGAVESANNSGHACTLFSKKQNF